MSSELETSLQNRDACLSPNSLIGKAPHFAAFRTAAELAMSGADALSQNGFKIDLGRHGVVRALTLATKDRRTRQQST